MEIPPFFRPDNPAPAVVSKAESNPAAWRVIATLHNALVTATVISLVVRHGSAVARDYVFRNFRRQHLEKFLDGLHKLGLAGQPHEVACALYHFHSNALGGVNTSASPPARRGYARPAVSRRCSARDGNGKRRCCRHASSAGAFAIWLKAVLEGQGEDVACESAHGSVHLHVERWGLGEGLGLTDLAGAFVAWNKLWAGACAAHKRFLQLEMSHAVTDGVLSAHWRVRSDAAGAVST